MWYRGINAVRVWGVVQARFSASKASCWVAAKSASEASRRAKETFAGRALFARRLSGLLCSPKLAASPPARCPPREPFISAREEFIFNKKFFGQMSCRLSIWQIIITGGKIERLQGLIRQRVKGGNTGQHQPSSGCEWNANLHGLYMIC